MTDAAPDPPSDPTSAPSTGPATGRCRFCWAEIPLQASKCRYCGEHQPRTAPGMGHRLGQIARYAGFIAAILGLIATLREGYFFLDARQQARNVFRSYLTAADEFKRLDNLEYARRALDEALKVYPDSESVATQRFVVASTSLLQEADFLGAISIDDTEAQQITALVQDGFRLSQLRHSRMERSELQTLLARLLSYDRTWVNQDAADELLAEAVRLAPNHAEARFWHGHHLLGADDPAAGYRQIQRAIELAPDNAFYKAELGEHLLADGRVRESLQPLLDVVTLTTDGLTLQQVRAVNEAKRQLGQWWLRAVENQAIVDEQFYQLTATERDQLLTNALVLNPSNRQLHYIAAQWFSHRRQPEKALTLLKKALYGDGNLDYIPSSDTQKLPLYLELLTTLKIDPNTRNRLTKILDQQSP